MTSVSANCDQIKRLSVGSVHVAVQKFENIRHHHTSTSDMCASQKGNNPIKGIVQNRVKLFEHNDEFSNVKPDLKRSISEDVLHKRKSSTACKRDLEKVKEEKAETLKGRKVWSNVEKDKGKQSLKNEKAEMQKIRASRRNRFFNISGSTKKDAEKITRPKRKEPNVVKEWKRNVSLNAQDKQSTELERNESSSDKKTKPKDPQSAATQRKNKPTEKIPFRRTDSKSNAKDSTTKKKIKSGDQKPVDERENDLGLELQTLSQISQLVKAKSDTSECKEYLKPLSKEELLENYHIVENIKQCYLEQMRQLYFAKLKHESDVNTDNETGIDIDMDVDYRNHLKIFRKENSSIDEIDVEFGYSTLVSEEETCIVEAYNKRNFELVISNLDVEQITIDENDNNNSASDHILRIPPRFTNGEGRQTSSLNSELTDLADGNEVSTDSDSYEVVETSASVLNGNDNSLKEHRETFYDNNSNPRIETVSLIKQDSTISRNGSLPLNKKDFVLEELVSTEETYISDLEKVVLEYKPFLNYYLFTDYPHLRGKEAYLFGNIQDILEESKIFLEDLKKCSYRHEDVAKTFINHAKLFRLYPNYTKNKPKADEYIQEFKPITKIKQLELGDKLDLASYLLTPIQRLGKYILFLQNIMKELDKQEQHSIYVQTALDLVKSAMSKGNDYLAIDSIQNCPKNLSAYGSFIMTDKFTMLKPKKLECSLFLFDDIIVFTVPHYKLSEKFTYIDSIKMNDLTIVIFDAQPTILHLKNFTKCKVDKSDDHTYVLEAKTEKLKKTWQDQIEKRLWEQLTKYKEQLLETYNGSNSASSSRKSSPKSPAHRSKTLPRNTKLQEEKQNSRFYVPLC